MLAILSNDRSDNLLTGLFERDPREELGSQIVATGFKTGVEQLEERSAIKRILILEAAINARRDNARGSGNSWFESKRGSHVKGLQPTWLSAISTLLHRVPRNRYALCSFPNQKNLSISTA